MAETSFVGRWDAAGRLLAVLRGDDRSSGKLSVLGVEGPGGIGKTFLLDHVLATNDLSGRNYLTLLGDGGAAENSVDLFSGVGRMVDAASARAIRGRPDGSHFSPTERVLERIEGIGLSGRRPGDLLEPPPRYRGSVDRLPLVIDDSAARRSMSMGERRRVPLYTSER